MSCPLLVCVYIWVCVSTKPSCPLLVSLVLYITEELYQPMPATVYRQCCIYLFNILFQASNMLLGNQQSSASRRKSRRTLGQEFQECPADIIDIFVNKLCGDYSLMRTFTAVCVMATSKRSMLANCSQLPHLRSL